MALKGWLLRDCNEYSYFFYIKNYPIKMQDFFGRSGLLRPPGTLLGHRPWYAAALFYSCDRRKSLELITGRIRKITAIGLGIDIKQAISNDYNLSRADATHIA